MLTVKYLLLAMKKSGIRKDGRNMLCILTLILTNTYNKVNLNKMSSIAKQQGIYFRL